LHLGVIPDLGLKGHGGGQICMASQLLGHLVIAVYPSPIEDAVLPQDMDRQHTITHNARTL